METVRYTVLTPADADRLHGIDRSETIDLLYEMRNGVLTGIPARIECPAWTPGELAQIRERYLSELAHGGMALGAFSGDILAGFGVLAHRFLGPSGKSLQLDLLYVSRPYRQYGIARRLLQDLSDEARRRGAGSLYISSTETRSAVDFYRRQGAVLTPWVDEELFRREPHDIHLLLPL